jgi:hypothetical protein
MWKCRFCSFETNNYEELVAHERECYAKYEIETRKKREEELTTDMNQLNTLRLEYERFADKMNKRYSEDELEKFVELFPVNKIKEKMQNKKRKYIPYYSLTDNDLRSVLEEIYG